MNCREEILKIVAVSAELTMSEIAREVGCSRQYVEQVLDKTPEGSGGYTHRVWSSRRKPAVRNPFSGPNALKLARKWLSEIGCGYCTRCAKDGLPPVKPIHQFNQVNAKLNPVRCGACNARNVRESRKRHPETAIAYKASMTEELKQRQREHVKTYNRKKLAAIYANGGEALSEYRKKCADNYRIHYWRKRGVFPPPPRKGTV